MNKLPGLGIRFYGISIAGLGILTVIYADFPYMLIPQNHSWIPALAIVSYIFAAGLILAGISIVSTKKINIISLLLGVIFLIIFIFYFIPYQWMDSSNVMQLGDWENAEKELALCGGAFIIAGHFYLKNENAFNRIQSKLIPFGTILYVIPIISFGLDQIIYAKDAADYIPSWIPHHIFWIYFTGFLLAGAGIAILLKIKVKLIATLLGTMIFIWFLIVHTPYVIEAHFSDKGGEVTSAFLALAYSGIAFIISGTDKKDFDKTIPSQSNRLK